MPKPTSPKNAKPKDLRWWSDPRSLLRYILSLDDSTHRIALGTAIGMFIGLTPTVGMQMILVLLLYLLLSRVIPFNCKAALVTVYVSNPLTMLPIYWFDYKVGQVFLGGGITREEFAAILQYDSFAGWWTTITTLFVDLGWPMCVGAAIVGSIGAAVTYPAMRYGLHLVRRGPKDESPRDASAPAGKTPAAPTGR